MPFTPFFIIVFTHVTMINARIVAGNTTEQETACMTTCIDTYKHSTRRCCVHLDCDKLPVQDLVPYIGQCPADGMWLKWAEWSQCSNTCAGVRARHRYCHYPAHLPQGEFCIGHGTDIDYCGTHTC